ncbi:hypothetical protein BH09PSE3_BH09PSE3_23360 [soil metagenome]
MKGIVNTLKGLSGELEAGRVLWVFDTIAFIVGFNVFQGIAAWKGQAFSPVEYGTGFGGGLATILALGGVGISQKDRGVAKAAATGKFSDPARPISPRRLQIHLRVVADIALVRPRARCTAKPLKVLPAAAICPSLPPLPKSITEPVDLPSWMKPTSQNVWSSGRA